MVNDGAGRADDVDTTVRPYDTYDLSEVLWVAQQHGIEEAAFRIIAEHGWLPEEILAHHPEQIVDPRYGHVLAELSRPSPEEFIVRRYGLVPLHFGKIAPAREVFHSFAMWVHTGDEEWERRTIRFSHTEAEC